MMAVSEMNRLAAEAAKRAKRAKRDKKQPYIHTKEGYRGNIPFLGDYVPRGWERTERELLFVDTSGFGAPGEPALTTEQMFEAFTVGMGYALVEVGQFQGYIAEYKEKE